MSDFTNIYALTGNGYDRWDEARTQRELRLHLFEVGYRLERVSQGKGNGDADKEELSKETADLLILIKHFVLSFGGGEDTVASRHAKFKRDNDHAA
jgi:hypothetical protein